MDLALEHGDVFFFYRGRIDAPRVRKRSDVARLYMVLAPRSRPRRFRLFAVGRKRLPEIHPGRSHPNARNWAVNLLGLVDASEVRRELAGKEYPTLTRGLRRSSPATPVGEGRYRIQRHDSHTELAYVLDLPERLGAAQAELQIKREAAYILALRNPGLSPRGAHYPPYLLHRFGGLRWIPAEPPSLLDVEGAEVLLLGAREAVEQLKLDLELDADHDREAAVFRALHLDRAEVPLEPLYDGEFPLHEGTAASRPIRLAAAEAPGAAHRGWPAPVGSAAFLARSLAGVQFPRTGEELVQHAQAAGAPEVAVGQLHELPPFHRFANMAEVTQALGEVRDAAGPFVCQVCGDEFVHRTQYERHLVAAHPPKAPSAADLEHAIVGVHFPRTPEELADYAKDINHAKREIVELLRALPERPYHDAAELAQAFGELKRRG